MALLAIPQQELGEQPIIRPLLAWYRKNGRHGLPWREDRDPYHVLVSELMLQQTQVPRVIPKYRAFISSYPDVHALARASRADVLRAWQGLGYNSRAIRLHELAKRVSADGGRFPRGRDELLALPGIGPYTAGAVRIFAFDEPDLSVDVNVRRVIARAILRPRQRATPARIDALARGLIERSGRPHDWHSALMDLGSTVCVARDPACGECPLRTVCANRGSRPDERAQVAAKKAVRFTGSNRWWRGRVLALALREPRSARELPALVLGRDPSRQERTACARAIEGLVRDGVASQDRGLIAVYEG